MSLYLTVHKLSFFFSFWCNKVCLAEGGSAYGCGRACVKEGWDMDNHTSHLGQEGSVQ